MTTVFSFAKKHVFAVILACMVVAIAATRLPGLMHNSAYHHDEWTFYESASSVVTGDYTFSPSPGRVYPNGAFVWQMPFHFLGQVLAKGGEHDRAFMGRLASVFYFTAGAALGLLIVRRLSRGGTAAMAFYAAIMSFSLFHIEQSRYGTGDAISFFLIMLALTVLQIYQREGDRFYLLLASFFVGALTAVKFPLLVFIALPVAAAFLNPRLNGRSRVKDVLYITAAAVAGLLAFTPQFFLDNAFFMKAFFHEYQNFMVIDGRMNGGIAGNFVSLIIYQLLYADIPLAPVFAACGFIAVKRQKSGGEGADSGLYRIVLPVLALVFMLANCSAGFFVLRTLYPFFVICNLYAAVGLARLTQAVHGKRLALAAAAVSIAVMAVRGGIFARVLSQDGLGDKIGGIIERHEKETGQPALSSAMTGLNRRYQFARLPQPIYFRDDVAEAMLPGEYLMVFPPDSFYNKVRPFLPRQNSAGEEPMSPWDIFVAENGAYFVDTAYPEWYSVLFGGWLYPSTLEDFEFRDLNVYYRDYTVTAETQAALEFYGALRNEPEWPAYMSEIQGRGETVVAVAGRGSMINQWLEITGSGYAAEAFEDISEDSFYFASLRGSDVLALQPLSDYAAIDTAGVEYEVTPSEGALSVLVNGRRYDSADFLFLVYDTVLERVMDSKTWL